MDRPRIPLQRSVAVSLGIHILVFGTALAFAHYGASFFSGPGIITVDLVGEGGHGGPRTGVRRREQGRTEPHVAPVRAEQPVPAQEQPGLPAAKPSEAVSALSGPHAAGSPTGENRAVSDGSPGSPGGGGGLSSQQWRLLQAAIERAKSYPRLARERGIEGTVLVRFQVLPSGVVDHVEVARSSGAGILDDASVETVYRAGPMPYVRGWIEVPLVYELLTR